MQGGNFSNIVRLTVSDEAYPPLLREIKDPPQQLFVRGSIEALTKTAIAVIGTRKLSPYGARTLAEIVPPLAERLVIVSGLALGADGAAHSAAIMCNGTTVAVLGSGVDDDSLYPASHLGLAHRIIESGGALLSEHPPGTHPYPGHFPVRNRIIAGMCRATLICEAAEDSGTLITARCALEYNRDVYAIPGSIYSPQSAGTNALIKEGAGLVRSADDVFLLLGMDKSADKQQSLLIAADERAVLEKLGETPHTIEWLMTRLKWPLATVSSVLVRLEMMNLARSIPGQGYVRV